MAVDAAEMSARVTEPALLFDRTIDRRQVHRSAVSEVFLTDLRAVGEGRVLVAGQLPTCHSYFSDHAHEGSAVDALLVMEICRQATLASAHELGVPLDTILISAEFDLEITDPDAWRVAGLGSDVRIDSRFSWTRIRRGRPRAGVCDQDIVVGGVLAARHRSSGTLLTRADMANLRAAQRGTPPLWTADLVDRPVEGAVAPAEVGRRDQLNVVLADLGHAGADRTARVAPRWSNRALFDHSYDHLTMQVLTEAARQLALLHVGGGALQRWQLTGLTGRFAQFAELDEVVTARAAGPDRDGHRVSVAIDQDGETVAELTVTFEAYGDPEMSGSTYLWTDFGGVLTPPIEQSFATFCRDHGIERSAMSAAMAAVGARYGVRDPLAPLDTPLVSERDWLRQVSDELGGALPLTTVADVWFDGRPANADWIEVLRSLRSAGVGVGMLSNMVPTWDNHWRRMVDVGELFDDVVLSFEVGSRKPEPEIFALAAERAGVPPQECVLVDDVLANCVGAEAAGWRAVHFIDADSAATQVRTFIDSAVSLGSH